jgi:GNAT superfamily N-acetyltransferase
MHAAVRWYLSIVMSYSTAARHALSKLVARVAARGPREIAALGAARLTSLRASRGTLIFLTKSVAPEAVAPTRPELVFQEARPEDGERYARDIGTDSATTFRARLSSETHCFLVTLGEQVVHASWLTTAGVWTREIARFVAPPKGDAYVYESYTRPDARGRGIYPFALRSIEAWASGHGVGRLWIAVEDGNPSSRRAIDKAGFAMAFEVPFGRKWGRVTLQEPTGPRVRDATLMLQEVSRK